MRTLQRLLAALTIAIAPQAADAQVAELSGVINRYVAVTRVDSCGPVVEVESSEGFVAGERVLLVQVKGGAHRPGHLR
jgi:hypothetical protein